MQSDGDSSLSAGANERVAWVPDLGQLSGLLSDVGNLRVDQWSGEGPIPASSAEVELVIAPLFPPSGYWSEIRRLPRLRTVQLLSAGYEHLLDTVPPGVALCSARGVHDPAVAEWVVAVILAQQRSLPAFWASQARASWERHETRTLVGSSVLLVGYGSIAKTVERYLGPFGVEATAVASHARDGVHAVSQLADLLATADIVVLLLPDSPGTRGLIDARMLAAMKSGALLVNAGRGSVVDTDALVAELDAGRIRAALDVVHQEPLPAQHPLWKSPGLILTPHVASDVTSKNGRMYRFVAAQLRRFAAGEALENIVQR